jgi:hypothetical protein
MWVIHVKTTYVRRHTSLILLPYLIEMPNWNAYKVTSATFNGSESEKEIYHILYNILGD